MLQYGKPSTHIEHWFTPWSLYSAQWKLSQYSDVFKVGIMTTPVFQCRNEPMSRFAIALYNGFCCIWPQQQPLFVSGQIRVTLISKDNFSALVIFQCQPLDVQCCYISLGYPVASGVFLYSGCPVDWQHWPAGIWVSILSVLTFQFLIVFIDTNIHFPDHLMKKIRGIGQHSVCAIAYHSAQFNIQIKNFPEVSFLTMWSDFYV